MNGPVGYDKHGYGYRSGGGERTHDARREAYGSAYGEGDVVGMYVHLGGDAAAHPSVKKADVQRAAVAALRGELPVGVYNRVMGALCTHTHGAWVLQTGEEHDDAALPPGFAPP